MKVFGRVGVIVLSGLLVGCSNNKPRELNKKIARSVMRSRPEKSKPGDIAFHGDGTLSIISSSGAKIIDAAYERANTPEKRAQGLMYRTSMDEQQSMLFVYEDVAPRYFYMKNTYIPLDILFLDGEKKVVSICRNTKPCSEELLPSVSGARYALEVCAGFCQRHGVVEGDLVTW